MKIFAGVIPGVACLLGALILIWFPLRGTYLKKVQEDVLLLHQEKQEAFNAMEQEEA